MKKIYYILIILPLLFLSCGKDNDTSSESGILSQGGDEQSLNPQNALDRYIEKTLSKPYNIDIVYRFLEREIYRSYTFAPTQYEKAVEFVNVFNYLFIEPYIRVTSQQFMKEHSFNSVVLIGEPAFNPSGVKITGFANAGIKIHLLEVNNMEPNNIYYLNDNILATLYHENAHTWHQAKLFSTEYEHIVPWQGRCRVFGLPSSRSGGCPGGGDPPFQGGRRARGPLRQRDEARPEPCCSAFSAAACSSGVNPSRLPSWSPPGITSSSSGATPSCMLASSPP